MTKRRSVRAAVFAFALVACARLGIAQKTDSVRVVTGAFVGHLRSVRDSTPVVSGDIRLIRVDSAVTRRSNRGNDSLEIFVDSLKTRVVVTDSTGAFAIRALPVGAYLFDIRRIGYEPLHGALAVDSTTLGATIYLKVVSTVLAKVVVTATPIDRVKEKLEHEGFNDRSHLGLAAEFIERPEILRRKPQKLQDILAVYGIDYGVFRLDRQPVEYQWIKDYPAELVIGIEIYRHSRPEEFNGTRGGPTALTGHDEGPLVLIWTFIP